MNVTVIPVGVEDVEGFFYVPLAFFLGSNPPPIIYPNAKYNHFLKTANQNTRISV